VTGANRGIGAAIVQEMLKAGVAKIFATARNPKMLPAFGERPLCADPLWWRSPQKMYRNASGTAMLAVDN
jgi:NAD(P)-dependent dehydrogenase (short-subunit alcohol dehydrogenase family)